MLTLGLATAEELGAIEKDEDEDHKRGWYDEDEYVPVLSLPYKLQRLFQHDFPGVHDVRVTPVWVVGEVLHEFEQLKFFNEHVRFENLAREESGG